MTLLAETQIRESATLSAPHPTRNQRGIFRLVAVSGLLMAVALPFGIYPRVIQSAELSNAHQQVVAQLPTVSVTRATPSPAIRQLSLPGNVEAVEATGIYARRDGYIHARYADIGDTVKADQLLAEIETPEVDETAKEAKAAVLTNTAAKSQAQASLEKAKADLDTAQSLLSQAQANLLERKSNEELAAKSFQRWNALVKQGAVSTQDADEKDTNYKSAQAATKAAEDGVKSAESQVTAAKAFVRAQSANIAASDANIQAAVARQRMTASEQGFQKVVAPFAGVITERNIDRGSLISSGSDNSKTTLYRLARIDEVKVFIDVPEYASTGIHIGQSVAVTIKEFPGKVFTGKVARTSVALNASARTLRTEIHVANKDMRLVPGMYADVNFSVARTANILLIPANALVSGAQGPQVVVVSGQSVKYHSVGIGDDLGQQVEVKSGLTAADTIVVNPSDSLRDGTQVKVENHS